VRHVVADGHPLADRQGKLDLGDPVRVTELLGLPDLREAPRLWTARGRLVQVGQFLAELNPLAILEIHAKAYLRHQAVRGSGLVMEHHPLDGGPSAEELFALGRGHRLLMLVMMKQPRTLPR